MELNTQAVRDLLKGADLYRLFVSVLGWNNPSDRVALPIEANKLDEDGVRVGTQVFMLKPIAQKREAYVYECEADEAGNIPVAAIRQQIERKVRKLRAEHLIIFLDGKRERQLWQWVAREPGRPDRYRDSLYDSRDARRTGDALIAKLDGIRFRLSEEEELTITAVVERVAKNFDVERVTKRFYDAFSREQRIFCDAITGIDDDDTQQWYASLMLNRLMFVYFIQQKQFLDGDRQYLRNRLEQVSSRYGVGHYQEFYREFLLRLFHHYLNRSATGRATTGRYDDLIGRVPYLNGGLFEEHQIERDNKELHIPDDAFKRVFNFFDSYDWVLDDRPTRSDREINPDVLGYIFEKYINQKQMGAYYTKEDITGYIARNTIIPFLFDKVADQARIALRDDLAVWQLLRDNPDDYIYPAVKSEDYLLTETEREYAARRARYAELRGKLERGEVNNINDLITYNLDIVRFSQDVIVGSEGPDLVRAFYHAIAGRLPQRSGEQFQPGISVLDPTCGSGAFLFAALNILAPIYQSCLDVMERFVEDERTLRPTSRRFADFDAIQRQIERHPNRDYFIYKSIIINNLYGVDIMPEAVEIARLRLFLKLAAAVDYNPEADNMGLEPLPDIDFNIVAGNTLVGYATAAEVEKATREQGKQLLLGMMGEGDAWKRIERRLEAANEAYQTFRQAQIRDYEDADAAGVRADIATYKADLRERLNELTDELDQYLALQYGVYPNDAAKYKKWRSTHQPLHWLAEFYGIVKGGGFDVIIGNPPYVEYSKVKSEYTIKGYTTEECGNLYANVLERCLKLARQGGYSGMIVQLPIVCTDRMIPLQNAVTHSSSVVWFSSYDDRPGRLFDGLEHIRATIVVNKVGGTKPSVWTTKYNRWLTEARNTLFPLVEYNNVSEWSYVGAIPKAGGKYDVALARTLSSYRPLASSVNGGHTIYFHNAPQYWIRATDFVPYFWNERSGTGKSTQIKPLVFADKTDAAVVCAILNSSLFYWWFILLSDCRHLNMREIDRFPVGLATMKQEHKKALAKLNTDLMDSYRRTAKRKEAQYKTTGKVVYDEYYPRYSKPIIDEIDRVLAQHYGFTDEELDFIINYDIKYRMGRDAEED